MIYIALWNVFVFLLYGFDKLMAKYRKKRISEFCLVLTAILAGGIGAASGMIVFHHKISKWLFRITVPLALTATVGIIVLFERGIF